MRTLRPLICMLVLVPGLALAGGRGASPASAHVYAPVDGQLVRAIRRYRATTLRLQIVMGLSRELRLVVQGHPSRRRVAALWRRRADATWRRFVHPPHYRDWLCIHHYEGAWTDSGAPYYGGLQMDLGFQSRYGGWLLRSKGTANHWTPLEQMWVAENAYRSGRGFYPWPNTARYCGLI